MFIIYYLFQAALPSWLPHPPTRQVLFLSFLSLILLNLSGTVCGAGPFFRRLRLWLRLKLQLLVKVGIQPLKKIFNNIPPFLLEQIHLFLITVLPVVF